MKRIKCRKQFWLSGILALLGIGFLSVTASAIENSECMRCHSDNTLKRSRSDGMRKELFLDDNKFKFSVHNVNEINCNDCHFDIESLDFVGATPHAVSLNPMQCGDCHVDEADAYINSVHYKAREKGITIPCYACHGYHYVSHLEAESVFDRQNGFCLKCHEPEKFHDWLPQKDIHFSQVECVVCHAPETPRYVNLRLFDLVSQKYLSGGEILEALETDYEGFSTLIDRSGDGIIDTPEFEEMVLKLRLKDVWPSFHGELLIQMTPEMHHVNRGKANSECETCHNPASPFFDEVVISINRDDGTTDTHKVERAVLSTYHLNHFYALGGTRVGLLDKIGLAMLAFAGIFVFGHLALRIATRSARDSNGRTGYD